MLFLSVDGAVKKAKKGQRVKNRILGFLILGKYLEVVEDEITKI